MQKILWLFFIACFISSPAFANFYEDQNDFDPSFQNTRETNEINQAFPAYPTTETQHKTKHSRRAITSSSYDYDLPRKVNTTESFILVDPNVHAWGAYDAKGDLIRAGRASAGAEWCSDIGRSCKTKAGTFRIGSLGDEGCVSSKYPIDEGGGAPMPYCMYFNGAQGLHGSNHVVEGNISHGCVRLRVSDAEWIRYHFAHIGTKVIIKSY